MSDPMGNIMEVEHVDAAYGPYRALFDVSFTIPAGGVVALIGSNGAGKSTAARTITGLGRQRRGRFVSMVLTSHRSPHGRSLDLELPAWLKAEGCSLN